MSSNCKIAAELSAVIVHLVAAQEKIEGLRLRLSVDDADEVGQPQFTRLRKRRRVATSSDDEEPGTAGGRKSIVAEDGLSGGSSFSFLGVVYGVAYLLYQM